MNMGIKFRGQNRLGIFVYGMPLLFDTNKDCEEVTLVSRYIAEDGTEHQEEWIVQRKTIGQYTGLKDKNGNEVYEGDIVKHRGYNGVKNSVVKFEAGAFIVGYHDGSSTKRRPMLLHDKVEVIGNIHDDHELSQ